MASFGAYGIVLDTYYAVKPKNHMSSVLTGLMLCIFHAAFLGHRRASRLVSCKLICLLDMLLHVADMALDIVLVVAVMRCFQNPVRTAMLESSSCQTVSLVRAIISILYQFAILAAYYCRLKVTPAEKPPCYAFLFLSWLRDGACELLFHPEAAPLDSQILGDTFEVERTLHVDEICYASFEVSNSRAGIGVTRRHTAATTGSALQHQDDIHA
ncbi:uncharacterized protein LOC144110202 [Amblyomma americanum]